MPHRYTPPPAAHTLNHLTRLGYRPVKRIVNGIAYYYMIRQADSISISHTDFEVAKILVDKKT